MSANRMARADRNKLLTAQRVTLAVTAVVNQTPQGVAEGLLYAPLRQHLDPVEFAQMMRLLVETGRVRKRGDRYFPAEPAPCSTRGG